MDQEESEHDFGWALRQMKAGLMVQRVGWNGKGMHIYMEDARSTVIGEGVYRGQKRETDAVLCMYTAQGTHQPGWNASQADMFATDWQRRVD